MTHRRPSIAACDADTRRQAAADPITRHLVTAPGVGVLTALAYRATLDEVARFPNAGSVTAFVGLVPHEHSSGARHRRGGITKAGPRMLRTRLVQAAWTVWRQRRAADPLYQWVHAVAARRGRRIAVIGLARRLARVLDALWRDDADYRVMAAA